MPTLPSNAAMKQSPSSAIERWLTGATRSHLFLLVFFGVGILAAVIGFSHRGGDMLAYPLFAWSPFMLVLGLQQLTQGFRKSRDMAGLMMAAVCEGSWLILMAVGLFALACYLHSIVPLTGK